MFITDDICCSRLLNSKQQIAEESKMQECKHSGVLLTAGCRGGG